jgi:hypothetical protein
LVPVRKQPGLKAGAFSPALLVPVATTGTNERYKPGPMAFFPPVVYEYISSWAGQPFVYLASEFQFSFNILGSSYSLILA